MLSAYCYSHYEAIHSEVRTLFVQGDLHSMRCRCNLAHCCGRTVACVGLQALFIFFCGGFVRCEKIKCACKCVGFQSDVGNACRSQKLFTFEPYQF